MSSQNGLNAAIGVATRQRDEAVQALALARQSWVAMQLQLDQLQTYAQDTDARWSPTAGRVSTPEFMRHHYQFMQRLDHAIRMQVGVVDVHARQVEERAATLRDAEARLDSLQQIVKSRAREQQVVERRREQKQVDEIAALQYRRNARGQLAGGL